MRSKEEIRQFLVSRRANVTPAQMGLPDYGDERRVPGLRREEVAQLAGVSTDYYTRLERGNIQGASDSVLNAIARALQLTDVEREHLFDLARPAPVTHAASAGRTTVIRPSVRRMLNAFTAPAVLYNVTQDIVAANVLGRALFAPHFESDRPNMARFTFLDSRAPHFYQDWPMACSLTAATLRFEAGKDPLNEELTALIGELSTRSPQFRRDWADQDVHEHRTGTKAYRHPAVGDLELDFENLEMPGEPGLQIVTFNADEGSPSADKLILLAAWAATQDFEVTEARDDVDDD
ncbi:helix-turn-helix transcriptional regulator [Actinoallomurus sp. CA-150999]|uniref:helix-turn-helix transcriptional regulator n=1 Tax=Actinoallomurus sp. CA-150999 TaxID=3239887 RepID=UPI003D8C125C